MKRISTILATLFCLLTPLQAAGFWLPNDGQCATQSAPAVPETKISVDVSEPLSEEDCASILDPSDSSYNACFELAENPISTLPELIAQTQAERVVAQLMATSDRVLLTPVLPSPDEASVEDPRVPGRQLVAKARPYPRPTPNSCSVYPDDCENAPVIPTLNLEGSPHANDTRGELDIPPPVEPVVQRGPPAPGVGPAIGITVRLDRPPQVG